MQLVSHFQSQREKNWNELLDMSNANTKDKNDINDHSSLPLLLTFNKFRTFLFCLYSWLCIFK